MTDEHNCPVDIPDAGLRKGVGKAPGETVTRGEMAELRELCAIQHGICDLEGIQFAAKLKVLVLARNCIKDATALGSLTNLERLVLTDNSVEDVSALGSLSKLKELGLSGNGIKDVSALSSLSTLKVLDLSSNNIEDVSALGSLSTLKRLYLARNSIEDVSALVSLPNLKMLTLEGHCSELVAAGWTRWDSGVWTRPATTSNYDVRQGRTCFGGTRLPVDHLFRHLAAGGTIEGFLENHDHVKREQVVATIKRAGYVLVARAPERRRYLRERRARWHEEREFDRPLPPRDERPLERA